MDWIDRNLMAITIGIVVIITLVDALGLVAYFTGWPVWTLTFFAGFAVASFPGWLVCLGCLIEERSRR